MFFSVGAMLVAGFAIFGMFAAGNQVLRDAVIDLVAEKARHDALPLPVIGAEHAELRVAAQASARPVANAAAANF